jgi:predicted transcriptional regulator
MLAIDLKNILIELELSQVDFARLIGVTARAVTLWMVGDRGIPGPVESYARLLSSIPVAARQAEFKRLKERKTNMRDGMYGVEYTSVAGAGVGVLILDNGRVFGADPFGGKYDGEYLYNEVTGLAELRLKLTFAPNAPAVFGITNPYEWSIDVAAKIDPRLDSGQTRIATPVGPQIDAQYRYLRALPEA